MSRTAEKDTPVPDDGDPWRCAECGGRREVHIVGERDGTVTHIWQPRIFPPAKGDAR